MAANFCILASVDKNKDKKICNGEYCLLRSLTEEDKLLVTSEISCLSSNFVEDFKICSLHLSIVKSKFEQRIRRKLCDVNEIYTDHRSTHIPKADRHVTCDLFEKILSRTGIFIPVGTAICRRCREKLTGLVKSKDEESKKEESSMETLHVAMSEMEDYQAPSIKRRKMNFDTSCYYEGPLSQTSQCTVYSEPNCSQASNVSFENDTKLEKLNDFLKTNNISPIKKIQNPFTLSSERTQSRYIDKTEQCFRSVLKTICPNDTQNLLESVLHQLHSPLYSEEKKTLRSIYMQSDTSWQLRRQILSIITQGMSFEEAEKFLPGLTSWRFYESKKHASGTGVGLPVVETTSRRDKIDTQKLEHFVEFITSTHVIKDLPYGQKTLKLETGEIVTIPNVIRSLTASTLIDQYIQLCEEENVIPLGKSTLYRVCTECSASVRQSVEGLDNFVMEGSRAFKALEEQADVMGAVNLKMRLLEAKRYLKSDFKVHLSRQSDIQDHCIVFAMSDLRDDKFKANCSHTHTQRCASCSDLENVLGEIQQEYESREWENNDAVSFKVEKAVHDIKQLQRHIVRSKNQESARVNLVKNMQENDVIITADWAMKYLPRKYREGQMDWFAKRGINWHVSVAVVKLDNLMKTFTNIHVFSGQISQDAPTTAAVLCDVVADLKNHVKVNDVHFISDNAGCYKSAVTLSTLKQELPELVSYNFSESQNGKGPCDRKAANAKAAIKRFLNEGQDVTTAEDMKKALDKVPNGKYRVKVVDAVHDLEADKQKHSLPNISTLFNFAFEEEGLHVWQAYNIGKGKLIPWKTVNPSKNSIILKTVVDYSSVSCALPIEEKKSTAKQHYVCPREGCIKEFGCQKALEEHLLLETCEWKLEKSVLSDRAKMLYATQLESVTACPEIKEVEFTDTAGDMKTGWALKENKKRTSFNGRQKQYMLDKFNIGKLGGCKVDPYSAAEDMRLNKSFRKEDYLTGQQIVSYFSRLSQQNQKFDALDAAAAREEERKSQIKREILIKLELKK